MAQENYKFTILALALAAFTATATFARSAYTDLSGVFNAGEQAEKVRIVYANAPTVEDAVMKSTPSAISEPTSRKVEFGLDYWKRVRWDVSDKDSYETGGDSYRRYAPLYGATLGAWVEAQMFRHLARDVSTTTGTAGTAAFTANLNNISAALQAISERNADAPGMQFYVRPKERTSLLNNAAFTGADTRGSAGERTNLTAALGDKFGFEFITSNNIPQTVQASDGAFAAMGAAAINQNRLAVDGAGAAGVGAGELLTIGTEQYAVDVGIGADAGTLTLNRDISTAIADNTAITSPATHGQCWALHPSAMAFGMRPTISPDASNINANVMSLVDPNTGFSITLEEIRLEHGTRYILSVLCGMKTVRPEMVQRVLSDA